MLNPSVVQLLEGVADGLRAEVLDALGPGPARDQLQSAIAMLRRIARALPGLVPYLMADIADLEATLAALDGPTADPGRSDLPAPRPDPAIATLDELVAHDLQLRARLAERIEAGGLDPATDRLLRDALARLTERESGLRLSPWER